MTEVPIELEVDQDKKEVTIGVDVDGNRKVDIIIKLIITDKRFWYIVTGICIVSLFISKLGGLW